LRLRDAQPLSFGLSKTSITNLFVFKIIRARRDSGWLSALKIIYSLRTR